MNRINGTNGDAIRTRRSMDFSTRTALVLTLVTLAGLLFLSLVYSDNTTESASLEATHRRLDDATTAWLHEDSGGSKNYSSYSCNFIYEVTNRTNQADQCEFAKTCNRGAGVWAPAVFCSQRLTRTTYCLLLSPVMLLWMVLLFRLLGSTAEDFFSPALEMFSVKLGLPPRFAGVTLLALGNGAADVSATVASITNDPATGYKMSLGALTGAAMVISGVISAAVILAADGVPCRGALVRDVTALIVTVVTVFVQLKGGVMGPESISLFLTLYAMFVLLVLTADIYHRAVVLPRLAATADAVELERQMQAAQDVMSNPSMVSAAAQQAHPNRLGAVLSALSNYDTPSTTIGHHGPEATSMQGSGWGIESEDLAHERPIQLHGQGGLLDRHSHGVHHLGGPTSLEQDPDNSYTIIEESAESSCIQTGSFGVPAESWGEALDDGRGELIQHAAKVWDDIHDDDVHPISKFLLLCELPFTVMRQITVPIPCEGYYCRALIALSLALSPLCFGYYLWSRHDLNLLSGERWIYSIIIELCVCLFALCILRFAPGGNGEMALVFSTPLALYGFIIAATWIDTIADLLVSLLNFIGIILRIPGPIIGLTILAWGNSMGDLSANMTMARKGLANMAMTACFAGPVFNILVGLGLGFSSLAAQSGNAETSVSLSPSVTCGFVFIVVNAVALLGFGLGFGNGRIPKQFGYTALTVYTIYVISSIVLQSRYGDSEVAER
jgi:solute carrier family 24 (sodium/potassium/calcium exchanger), member 6